MDLIRFPSVFIGSDVKEAPKAMKVGSLLVPSSPVLVDRLLQ